MSLIATAWAATSAATPAADNGLSSILLLVGFIAVFYFLLWRPQAKRAKDQRSLIANLAKGDEVVTNGGLLGKINKITDDFITLAITDSIEVKVQRSAVTNVLPKGTLKTL